MSTPTLTRDQLGKVFKDQRTLLAFDQFQKQLASILPDQITALAALQYIVAAVDPLLPNARALVAGGGLSGTPGVGVFTLNVTSAPKWTTARTLSLTGDGSASLSVDGSANISGALTLASIISAGSATKVSFNAKGLVTGSSSAVLASSDFNNQGTSTTVLHGNAAGAPSWGSVALASDVSGLLPSANLADVFGSPGTYGPATVTVNSKGQITNAASAATSGTGNIVLTNSPALVTPALGTPSALVLTNATGLPLGGSGVTGTLTVANGGTGDTGTAWTTYTPTVTSTGGTLTTYTASGRYKTLGKTMFIEVTVGITNNGSGSTALTITLPSPFTAAAHFVLIGRDLTLTGLALTGSVLSTGSTISVVKYDNSYPVSTGSTVIMSGVIEVL